MNIMKKITRPPNEKDLNIFKKRFSFLVPVLASGIIGAASFLSGSPAQAESEFKEIKSKVHDIAEKSKLDDSLYFDFSNSNENKAAKVLKKIKLDSIKQPSKRIETQMKIYEGLLFLLPVEENFKMRIKGSKITFNNREINKDVYLQDISVVKKQIGKNIKFYKNIVNILKKQGLHDKNLQALFIANWTFSHLLIETSYGRVIRNQSGENGAIGMAQMKPLTFMELYKKSKYREVIDQTVNDNLNKGNFGFGSIVNGSDNISSLLKRLRKRDRVILIKNILEEEEVSKLVCSLYLELRTGIRNKKDYKGIKALTMATQDYNGGREKSLYAAETLTVMRGLSSIQI